MEQAVHQEQPQESIPRQLFRGSVDRTIVFGCVPALVVSVLCWAVATAFANAGALPLIMAMLVTALLAFMGMALIVRYVDVSATSFRKAQAHAPGMDPQDQQAIAFGAGVLCVVLAGCMVGCLATAGTLEGAHDTLMAIEVLAVSYQTWRVFGSKGKRL